MTQSILPNGVFKPSLSIMSDPKAAFLTQRADLALLKLDDLQSRVDSAYKLPLHNHSEPIQTLSSCSPIRKELQSRVDSFCRLESQSVSEFIQKESKVRHLPAHKPIQAYLQDRIERLCHLEPQYIAEFIQKEGKIRELPSYNPIRSGYQTREEYETFLAETFLISQIALSAFGILSIPKLYFFFCLLGTPVRDLARMERTCEAMAAESLFDTQGKAFLTATALLLCATFTLYRQKTLGSWLHDPFADVRKTEIKNFFLEMTHALKYLKTKKPEEAKKMAEHLLKRESVIGHALRFDLRLNKEETKQILEILRAVHPENAYQSSPGGKFEWL